MMTYLDALLRSSTTFITDSLQAAPFLTFAVFVLIHILFTPAIITLVFRFFGLASITDEAQTSPTCGVVDVPKDEPTQTEVH